MSPEPGVLGGQPSIPVHSCQTLTGAPIRCSSVSQGLSCYFGSCSPCGSCRFLSVTQNQSLAAWGTSSPSGFLTGTRLACAQLLPGQVNLTFLGSRTPSRPHEGAESISVQGAHTVRPAQYASTPSPNVPSFIPRVLTVPPRGQPHAPGATEQGSKTQPSGLSWPPTCSCK